MERAALKRYAMAVAAVGLALVLTMSSEPIRSSCPSALFFAAVMLASWFGGIGPGLLATALSVGAIDYFVMSPAFAVRIDLGDLVRILVFLVVASLISALNHMRRRLEEELRKRADTLAEVDRRKDEFLAVLAHELRTPLAAIRNALAVIRQSQDVAAIPPAVALAERQARTITRLVDDLLDASRIARGTILLRKEPADLGTIISEAVESARPAIDAKGHDLVVELPVGATSLEVDPVRIEQVVINLLNNAARYTEPGGRIRLGVGREGDQVAIRVRDTGIGIAAARLPVIFDLYQQADRTSPSSRDGLGIGLSLVRDLVRLHGGTIEARSDGLGLGSEFLVRLPATPAAEGPGTEPVARTRVAGRPLRILVVEDDPTSARCMKQLLGLWGYEARVAGTGPEALDLIGTAEPDVVLMDISLPGMDGREVASRLLQTRPKRPWLVSLSGHVPDSLGMGGTSGPFDAQLIKPVAPETLRSLLAEFEGHESREDGPPSRRPCSAATPAIAVPRPRAPSGPLV